MKIVFLVPYDYKKIGGLYLPIDNQRSILKNMGHNVKLVGVSYHPSHKEVKALIRSLIMLKNEGYKTFVSYTLIMSYTAIRRCAKYLPDCDFSCFLVDSMKLNACSVLKDLKFGKQYLLERLKLIKYSFEEKYVLNNVKSVGYVSPVDIKYVKASYKNIKSKIFCIPNGTTIYSRNPPVISKNKPLRIGALAGATEKTNRDNLFPFLDKAFPLIVKKHPEVSFVIAGNVKSENDVKHLKSVKNTVYLGFVDSLSDFYDNVDIIITTVKKECGVLNRVLEGWAYGKVVIGFEKNFRGFEFAQEGKDYIVANNWNDFEQIIDNIIKGIVDVNYIARHSNEMVYKSYSWEMSTNRLMKMIGW